MALLVPLISEVTFQGASIKLVETRQTADAVAAKATDLARNWVEQLADFATTVEDGIEPPRFQLFLLSFLRLRAYEAMEWLTGDGERRRLSLWIYDEKQDELSIAFSQGIDDQATLTAKMPRGRGIVGVVFDRQQTWNEQDASSLPVWERIRPGPASYHGIFLTPVNYGDRRLGVLCVDRRKRAYFDSEQENVIIALATIFGLTLGNPATQRLLSEIAAQVESSPSTGEVPTDEGL